MNVDESKIFQNIGASTAPFVLRGGMYVVTVLGSTFGTVALCQLGPDGSTYLPLPEISAQPALTSGGSFATNGVAQFALPPGQFAFILAGGTTAVSASIASIPS